MPQLLFPLGVIVATPAALKMIPPGEIIPAVFRHASGDWGDCCPEDKATNDEAVTQEGRVLSTYRSLSGEEFWIITEWDRSVTTVLLPADY